MNTGSIRTAVVVAPSPVPMRLGGAERHWDALRRTLEDAGVATDLVKLPVRESTLVDLLDAYEDFRLLDLSHVDLVISGKYPAWMVQHPNHVVWMLHPLRGLYDTYNAAAFEDMHLPTDDDLDLLVDLLDSDGAAADPMQVIDLVRGAAERLGPGAGDPGGALAMPGPLARAVVHHLDRWALARARISLHAAISSEVAGRRDYFPNGVSPLVVLPPSCLAEPSQAVPPGDGFLVVGRLDRAKRVDLAIAAMQRVSDPDASLSILGDGPERPALEAMAARDTRIVFRGRVHDAALRAAYANCRAVIVTPEHEDFGYVTIEAMQHGRAVITTNDSGGPCELAIDGLNALVVDPDDRSMAAAMTRVQTEPELALRLGEAGRTTAGDHSWPDALEQILTASTTRPRSARRRPRVVAVSTYPVLGWPGGGPERAERLLSALAESGCDVTIVALTSSSQGSTLEISEGLRQVTIAASQRHARAEHRLRRLTANLSVTDIAASVLWPSTPELVGELRHRLRDADAAIAVQPYLAAAITQLAPDRALVLDDHNHERALKAQMLPDDEAGHWMLDRVVEAEGTAAGHAALVVVTSDEDRAALAADHDLDPAVIQVIPNGVDTTRVHFTEPGQRVTLGRELLVELHAADRITQLALFVGSAHRPNVQAATEVVNLARSMPEVLFVLAGEHSDLIDPHDCGPNVRRLGAVSTDRLDRLLAGADVALNPMRTGGGTNLKLLGYFAAGVPVVTTALGARGVGEPSRFATVARIDRFTQAITESLAVPDRDKVMAARRLVEADFDWAVIGRRFADAVQVVVRRSNGPGKPDRSE